MSDFSKPEYASYVALCRTLELEREWQLGDWTLLTYENSTEGPGRVVELMDHDRDGNGPEGRAGVADPRLGLAWWWLPSLSDWLEMLEEAGAPSVGVERYGSSAWCAYNLRTALQGDIAGTGPSREEAAARLWMVVRKPAEVGG